MRVLYCTGSLEEAVARLHERGLKSAQVAQFGPTYRPAFCGIDACPMEAAGLGMRVRHIDQPSKLVSYIDGWEPPDPSSPEQKGAFVPVPNSL